jgi:predicted RNA binding protein YcfA (HicA-like mRNA interferase family)
VELITNCDEFDAAELVTVCDQLSSSCTQCLRVRANTVVVRPEERTAKIFSSIGVNFRGDRSFSVGGGSVRVSEILEILRRDGWYLVTTRGSHRQFKHATKPGRVTVPGKPSDDLPPGLLNSILKQSGLKR